MTSSDSPKETNRQPKVPRLEFLIGCPGEESVFIVQVFKPEGVPKFPPKCTTLGQGQGNELS